MNSLKTIKKIYAGYKAMTHKDPHPIIKVNGQDVIFIHILKTAGTSIYNAIGQNFKLHLPVTEVIRRVGKSNFENAYKFAFVRNPWDKVYSHYKYNVKTNQQAMKENPIDFNEWVLKCFGENKDYFYYHRQIQFTDQLTWLEDHSKNIAVDFIGRFESINEDFEKIREHLNIDHGLPHLNKTNEINSYREKYNSVTKEIIAATFKRDIEYFNYKF